MAIKPHLSRFPLAWTPPRSALESGAMMKRTPIDGPRRSNWRRRLRIVFLLLILPIAIPVAYSYIKCPTVWYYRWFNPRRTAMMSYREHQAEDRGEAYTLRYKPVPLAQIAPSLRKAAIMTEDGNFYEHHGFDFEAIRKAYKYNQRRHRIARGASTISQQLAKNLWLSPKQSYWRKLIEAILTVRLELALPKDRILELYLNCIEWGDGVFGAAAASQYYFHVTPLALSPQQSALMVAAIPSPRRSNPSHPSSYLQRRQRIILSWLLGNDRDDKQRQDLLDSIREEDEANAAPTPTPTPAPVNETPEELPPELFAPPPHPPPAPGEGKGL
jgi:monofunctional biosynthetic peptidoglycan transglycosylase